MNNDTKENIIAGMVITGGILFILLIVLICIVSYNEINLWSSSLSGKAELNKADWNRQIIVREAQAKKDAASLLAQAEVERAKGVALANKIIGDSLKDNESYLRYLWIDSLQNTKDQIIYVPTEANLPILEASRGQKNNLNILNKN